jgi:hypothetical protein
MSDERLGRIVASSDDVRRLLELHKRFLLEDPDDTVRMAFEDVLTAVQAAVAVANRVRRVEPPKRRGRTP